MTLYTNVDALGSVHDTQTNGDYARDQRRFEAFGGQVAGQGGDAFALGFAASSSYQTDADTGLMLLGNRYYDPSIGRFLSEDPAGDGGNWYAYCGNDPLDGLDPEGLFATGMAAPNGASYGNPGAQYGSAVNAMNNLASLSFGGEQERHRTVTTTMATLPDGTTTFTQTPGPWSDWQADGNFRLVQSVVSPAGAEAAEMLAEETGSSGLGAPGRIDLPNVQKAVQAAKNWLGKEVRHIINKDGDNVFMSKSGRKLRFDIKNPSPHANPHAHMQELINGKWENVVPRIYPKGVDPR